jgi:hypothetical protein
LRMKREEFLRICGDISKHNQLRLLKSAKRIHGILKKADPAISLSEAFLSIQEFYDWFHNDIFYYHLTKICELLNNITWGIHDYLVPEFISSYTVDPQKSSQGVPFYSFRYPTGIKSEISKNFYWELMNLVRAKSFLERFKTWKYLELRY